MEAQAAGLHCIVSDQVTREVAITKLIEFISLDEDINTWIDCILKYKIVLVRICYRKFKEENMIL